MSLETVQEVTSQPATPVAKTEEKKTGASNTSEANFAKMMAAKQVPSPFTNAVKAVQAPVTQEAENPTAEATTAEVPEVKSEETTTVEEAKEVLSPEAQPLDPKQQEILDKKINKEVAKRYQLKAEMEAKIAALEARVNQIPEVEEKEIHVSVPSDIPLAQYTTLEALNQYKESLANDIVEAEMLLYSDFPPEGKQTKWGHLTKDALIAALTQAKKDERTAIPAREKFLTTRTQVAQTASEEFPFLKDPAHPGYQMAKQALRDNPVLRAYPNSEYLVGLLVEGKLALEARKTATAKPVVKPKPKPTGGQGEITSDASITRAPTGLMNSQALQAERTKATGGKKSLGHKEFSELLKANQRFKNSQ